MKYQIELRNVTKIYRTEDTEVRAVDGVNLRVAKGEMIAIIGPSGSGKSTLLNLIGGITESTSGQLLIDGKNLSEMKGRELDEFRFRKIGFIFQSYNLIPTLTALENCELRLSWGNLSSKNYKQPAEYLKLVGLRHRLNHTPSQMSGGECQRVAIARALVTDPEIILGDEPTGNLDSKTTLELMGLTKRLNRELGKTILLVTHNPSVAKMTDRVLTLRDGRIIGEKGCKRMGKGSL